MKDLKNIQQNCIFTENFEYNFTDLLAAIEENTKPLDSLLQMPFFWNAAKSLSVICAITNLAPSTQQKFLKEYDEIQGSECNAVFSTTWMDKFDDDFQAALVSNENANRRSRESPNLRKTGFRNSYPVDSNSSDRWSSNRSVNNYPTSSRKRLSTDRNNQEEPYNKYRKLSSSEHRYSGSSSGSSSTSSTGRNRSRDRRDSRGSNSSAGSFDGYLGHYNTKKLGSLVKLIRNYYMYKDDPTTIEIVKRLIGEKPDEFFLFFAKRFPKLLRAIYIAICNCNLTYYIMHLVNSNR